MKKRKVQDGELHEIENKRRSRVVRDKKKGEKRLKPWTKKRKLRALLPVCLIAIFGVSIIALGSFGNVASNVVDEGFVTVVYPLPDDGSTPLEHSALENIGYMNARFKGQTSWYSEMHGTTVAAGVSQSVNTFKQYSDNVLIMADVTSSSLVNAARQFCYYGDEVMWRNGTSYTANSFDEMNSIVWKTGEPYAHMSVTDFKTRNGLPGTELFVYVINEQTLVDASEVIDNGDGTYTQSYVLDPARDKAPAHYVNQMKFTGGLTGLPEFSYIHVTYTFDSTWQVLSADIDEAYKAEMVITVNCSSSFHTEYSYNTPQAASPAFENYFKQYVGKGITGGDIPASVDAMGCITSAFLSGPVRLELTVSLNGNDVSGLIYFDASKLNIAEIMKGGQINLNAALADIQLRAQIGEIMLYLDRGTAYISAGSLKAKLSVEELIQLINRYTVSSDEAQGSGGEEAEKSPIFAIDDPATEEPDDGFTYVVGESALMKANLDLSSLGIDLKVPLIFRFSLDEENRASLDSADVSLAYGDIAATVRLDSSDKEISPLKDAEKADFIDLIPYADGLAELLTQENLKAEVAYNSDSFSVNGNVNLALKGNLRLSGDLLLTIGNAQLPVTVGFEDSVLYINIAGIKLRAGVNEIAALVGKLIPDGGTRSESTFGIAQVIEIVLKNDLLGLLNVSENDGVLGILVKGTELLKVFGVDFALGDVELSVTDGALNASVMGASVKVTKGESVTVEKEGYVEILPYVEDIIKLFTSEALALKVNYEQNGIKLAGDLTVNMKEFAVAGNVTVGYESIEKSVELYFAENTVYLGIGGLKVKASIQTILDLVTEITGESVSMSMPEIALEEVLVKVLSLDLPQLLQVSEENGKLCLNIKGTELMSALGVAFELGDIKAEVANGRIELSVIGATVAVEAGEKKTVTGLEEYKDLAPLVPYVGELKELFTSPVLKAEVNYESEKLTVAGEISVALQGGIKVSGEVTLTYGEASIAASLGYEDGIIYVNAAGMKLKLTAEDIFGLLKNVIPQSEGFDLQALLDTLLSEETLKNFEITEGDGVLGILVKGTELLKVFGVDFALGDVELSVTDGALNASVMGASVKVTKGESVTVEKEGYVEILPYVEDIIKLFTSEALALKVNYEQNGLKLAGDLTVNMKEFAVAGNVTVGYESIEKSVELYFAENTVYLGIDGLKVKASIQTVLDLVTEITGESVSMSMPEIALEEVLVKVLSLDLPQLLQVSEENGKLCLNIKGTELMSALGVAFELGDIKAEVANGRIDVAVIGATVTVEAGEKKTVTGLEEYKDLAPLVPYVGELKELFTSPVLKAEVNYESEKLAVAGEISVALQGGIKVSGNVTLTYGEASIAASLGYDDGIIYVNAAGMKLKLTAEEIMGLLKNVIPQSEGEGFDLQGLLDTLLSEETLKNFEITEGDGVLGILVKGTELLKVFGVDFALGDVELSVTDGALNASVMGASVKVTKGESVTVEKEGYVEILPYVEDIIKLFTSEALALKVNYEQNGIKLAGDLTVNMGEYLVYGTVKLGYQGVEKLINIYFDGAHLYLGIDGLKVCAGLNDIKVLVKDLIGSQEGVDFGSLVQKLLEEDISKLIALSSTENKLELLIHGNELLQALGVAFKLGDIHVTAQNGSLHASLLGISLGVQKGEAFTSDEVWSVLGNSNSYVDIGGILKSIPQILKEKAVSLTGSVDLSLGETDISFGIEQGMISWKNGLNVYLDLRLNINGTLQRIEVAIDKTTLQLAYGEIGVRLAFSEFADLEKALVKLYHQVRETADKIFASGNPLPEEVDGLMDLLAVFSATDSLGGFNGFENFDVATLLKELTIGAPSTVKGVCTLAWKGVSLELLNAGDTRLAGVAVNFEKEDLAVNGALNANIYAGEFPAMPALNYLDKAAFENLIDYLGAAVATLAETNLQISVSGEVLSTDTQTYPNGKKYDIKGDINYYAGATVPVVLDLDGKKLWVNSDVYLFVGFELISYAEGDQSLDIKLFILDSDGDGVLDIYASVSLLGRNSAAYAPLNLHARADELMPVLASALALMGIDYEFVTDYVLAPWLNATTTAQLKGFGNALKPMIMGLLGGGSASAHEEEGFRSFISAIQVGETVFTVSLPSDVLFGIQGDDLTVTIGKTSGENGARLSLVSVANIYGKGGAEKTSLSIGIEAKETEKPQPQLSDLVELEGIASLIKTIAKSATHEEIISGESARHEYVLNRNFYITGGILLNVSLVNIDLNIEPVAFSITIDENGDVGVNVRFEYKAVKTLGITAINGNTVVDLTGKNGMVYIKRVQYTDADQKPLAKPVTLYRAMPLSNFVSDLIHQAGFLFNLGDTISSALGSIDTSGSSGNEQTVEDIGTIFRKYVKSLEYVAGSSELWTLTVNGASLMDGMDDIVVKLGTDEEGAIRDLSIKAGLTASVITVKIAADLRFRNPCGIMDRDVERDVTTDVAGILGYGMGYKLDNVDWTAVQYLEGEYTSVDYVLAGYVLKTQYVVISTGAEGNDPSGTLYGSLDYPSIPAEYSLPGYKIEWKTIIEEGGSLPAGRTIEAVYVPLSYCLTFTSDREADGYVYNEELGLWTLNIDYKYGEALALPFAETPAERIVCFTDGAGNSFTSLDGWTMENTQFAAVWEEIVYTAVITDGDRQTVLTGKYGERAELPEPKETEGYRFVGWTVDGEAVDELVFTRNVTVTANYEPVTVNVRLVSETAASGFTLQDGKYVKTFPLTYGTGAVELPTESGAGISLVAFKDDAGTLFYRVENLKEDITLYAVWEEKGFTVTFVDEGGNVVKTLNARYGDLISARADVPAVPAKKGYTGVWSFGNGIVTGDLTINAAYTANEYTITVVSALPYEGFIQKGKGYEKVLRYVYGGAPVGLEALANIPGYWFKGYYEEENGKGAALTSVSGITENSMVYIWWQDNTVSVRLYSDVKFDKSVFDPQKNGYYVEKSYNDVYAIDYSPAVSGYQQLGWWYEENGIWTPVDNVERFHGQSAVAIWAVWIQNIDVVITDYSVNKTNLLITSTVTYNIMGEFTGGSTVPGKSSEIFQKAPDRTVQFVVYRNNKRDGLSGGDEIVLEGNTFRKLKMTCGNSGSSWNTAPYGGAIITHTFTYLDASGNAQTISTEDENCISLETFRYQFYNEAGELCNTVDIRGIYNSEVRLGDYLPAVPEKEGYTGKWLIDSATVVDSGNRGTVQSSGANDIVTLYTTDVKPSYTLNRYNVRLESEQFVEGWIRENGKYVFTGKLYYGATVSYYCDNTVTSTDTVKAQDNAFTLPVLDSDYVWDFVEVTECAINCYANRNVDSVVYSSEIGFEYNGTIYQNYSEELGENYRLLVPVREGYTFLGWYMNAENGWKKVSEADLQASDGIDCVTYNLQALWISDFKITGFNASRWFGKHTASASVTGGEFIGAFAKESGVAVQTNYIFFLNDDGATGSANRGNTLVNANENGYVSSYNFKDVKLSEKKYIHVAVQVSYTYGGETFSSGEVIQSYKF